MLIRPMPRISPIKTKCQNGTDHRAAATHDADATENDGGNDGQFSPMPISGRAAEAGSQHDTSQCRHETGHHEDDDFVRSTLTPAK